MKGACIKRYDQFIVDKLIQMGYKPVKQDIYFPGLFVAYGKLWWTDHPFKPWNPDGNGWDECKMFDNDDIEGFLEAAQHLFAEGIKVRHKTKGIVETIVGPCKVKVNGIWMDGVIYKGNDVYTGEPMTFVRTKEDFEENFEVII